MKTFLLPAVCAALLLSACDGVGAPAARDTTAPTVTLSRAVSDSKGVVVLTAAASDDRRVTKVEFYRGATLLATDTTAPYTYETSVTAARTGFTARAYDATGNVGTSAAFDIVTPYQGVWGWGLVDGAGAVVDSGAVIFFDEAQLETGVTGFGYYENESQTRSGFSLLGPLSAAGQLEAVFSASTDADGFYFAAQDADAALGTYQGSATVEGAATLFNADGTTGATVGFAMIQTSAVVPQSLGGQALARRTARERATAYLATRHVSIPTLKVNPAAVKAAADALRHR